MDLEYEPAPRIPTGFEAPWVPGASEKRAGGFLRQRGVGGGTPGPGKDG
jgi:hypothetical protein